MVQYKKKANSMVMISTSNPKGLKLEQLSLQVQNCIDDEIDIQCYNKIIQDVAKIHLQRKYHKNS